MSATRYLVLSDMHFGTPESAVNNATCMGALIAYIVERAPYEEIIFTGDLLDVNLATLTRSIEGRGDTGSKSGLFGFRDFLTSLNAKSATAGGLAGLARHWVYVPGNHDYKVWDTLATKEVCENVLASGQPLDPSKMPLRQHHWQGSAAFLSGVFQPFQVQDRVSIEYPNHVVSFGPERSMVFTHGHYLDPSQTRGNDLAANLGGNLKPAELDRTVRRIVIETAQYQAIANAVSFTEQTRGFINDLFGPDGIVDKLNKLFTTIGRWLATLVFRSRGGLRDKDISTAQLANIDVYVERFCRMSPIPKWFVFGHTHRQGRAKTAGHGIDVYNVGSCYMDRGMPITFLEVEVENDNPTVRLLGMDGGGVVRQTY